MGFWMTRMFSYDEETKNRTKNTNIHDSISKNTKEESLAMTKLSSNQGMILDVSASAAAATETTTETTTAEAMTSELSP